MESNFGRGGIEERRAHLCMYWGGREFLAKRNVVAGEDI
jgi:hypothetical protein